MFPTITIEPVENAKRKILDASPYKLILREGYFQYTGFLHHVDTETNDGVEEQVESTEEWDVSVFKDMISSIEAGYRDDLDIYVVRVFHSCATSASSCEFGYRDKKSAFELKEKLVAWRLS